MVWKHCAQPCVFGLLAPLCCDQGLTSLGTLSPRLLPSQLFFPPSHRSLLCCLSSATRSCFAISFCLFGLSFFILFYFFLRRFLCVSLAVLELHLPLPPLLGLKAVPPPLPVVFVFEIRSYYVALAFFKFTGIHLALPFNCWD